MFTRAHVEKYCHKLLYFFKLQFHEGYLAGTHFDGKLFVVLPLNHNKFLDVDALGVRKMRFQASK